jgi:hypothetical protein
MWRIFVVVTPKPLSSYVKVQMTNCAFSIIITGSLNYNFKMNMSKWEKMEQASDFVSIPLK